MILEGFSFKCDAEGCACMRRAKAERAGGDVLVRCAACGAVLWKQDAGRVRWWLEIHPGDTFYQRLETLGLLEKESEHGQTE